MATRRCYSSNPPTPGVPDAAPTKSTFSPPGCPSDRGVRPHIRLYRPSHSSADTPAAERIVLARPSRRSSRHPVPNDSVSILSRVPGDFGDATARTTRHCGPCQASPDGPRGVATARCAEVELVPGRLTAGSVCRSTYESCRDLASRIKQDQSGASRRRPSTVVELIELESPVPSSQLYHCVVDPRRRSKNGGRSAGVVHDFSGHPFQAQPRGASAGRGST